MNHDNLTDREKQLFASLEKEARPPAELEGKIAAKLKQRGLIRDQTRQLHWMRWAGGIAAGIFLFAAGMFYENTTQNTMNTIDPNKGYMLLLHEDARFQPGKPMAMFNEYSHWMEEAAQSGIAINGQELATDGLIIAHDQIQPADSKKSTTGYFIIEAGSMEEAVEIAKANPHVKYGGIIEIKPFMVR